MKSIYKDVYRQLLTQLVRARRHAEVSQQELADAIGRPQSYVSKVERGDRRLDLVEFAQICLVIEQDPQPMIAQVIARLKRGTRGK